MNVIFLGNSSSVHILTWIKIYADSGYKVEKMLSVHAMRNIGIAVFETGFGFKIFRYVILGIKVRFGSALFLHAHGASGYGLSAFLSGKPYIVTIYGSEILAKHTFFYRKLVSLILSRAQAITVTSAVAQKAIEKDAPSLATKIHCFHTGIDTSLLDRVLAEDSKKNDLYIKGRFVLSLRNTSVIYRTEVIIENYLNSKANVGQDVPLLVLLGNGNLDYFKSLQVRYSNNTNVVFVEKKIEYEDMLYLIKRCEFCINYPVSDQLSTSILEALYFSKNIVSSDLDSYLPLKNCDLFSTVENDCDLVSLIERTFELQHNIESHSAVEFVKDNYSIDAAGKEMKEILEQLE